MADKILTFNGKTISGPSGTGMVVVPEVGCKIGDDIWAPYDLDYKDPTMEDFSEYIDFNVGNAQRLPGDKPFGYVVVNGHTLYTCAAIKYLKENEDTLFPGWHLATISELENLSDYAHEVESTGGDWWESLDSKGLTGFNISDAYTFLQFCRYETLTYWQEGSGFADVTIGGASGIWDIKTIYGLDDYLYDYDNINENSVLFPVRLVKNK